MGWGGERSWISSNWSSPRPFKSTFCSWYLWLWLRWPCCFSKHILLHERAIKLYISSNYQVKTINFFAYSFVHFKIGWKQLCRYMQCISFMRILDGSHHITCMWYQNLTVFSLCLRNFVFIYPQLQKLTVLLY